jgi:hypothetical protein
VCTRSFVRYLAAKSDADHYYREQQREQDEIDTVPDTGKTLCLFLLRDHTRISSCLIYDLIFTTVD